MAPSVVIVIVLVMVFFSDISRKLMLFVGLVQTGIVLVGISNSYGSDNINGGGTACWWYCMLVVPASVLYDDDGDCTYFALLLAGCR